MINRVIYNVANLARKIGIDFREEEHAKVVAMKKAIAGLDNRLEFKIEQYPDGSWTAESINVDGIITGGKNNKDIAGVIKDAIFTYYEIPPYLCTDTLLRADNEPVTIMQSVYV
ncbi:MAG: hypothetical protein V1765_02390 [bacterium]